MQKRKNKMFDRTTFKSILPSGNVKISITDNICAERKPEVNKSLLGRLQERISNFWLSCRDKVTWKIILFKARMLNLICNIMVETHCKKEFHYFCRHSIEWIRNGKSQKMNFLQCSYCEIKQFYSTKDKQKYEQIQRDKKKWNNVWFKFNKKFKLKK